MLSRTALVVFPMAGGRVAVAQRGCQVRELAEGRRGAKAGPLPSRASDSAVSVRALYDRSESRQAEAASRALAAGADGGCLRCGRGGGDGGLWSLRGCQSVGQTDPGARDTGHGARGTLPTPLLQRATAGTSQEPAVRAVRAARAYVARTELRRPSRGRAGQGKARRSGVQWRRPGCTDQEPLLQR